MGRAQGAGWAAWAGCVVCLLVMPAQGAVVGIVDTFQDGLQNWDGAVDAHETTGGPAGAGDAFLRASSGSLGSTPHLAVFNEAARYQGDYPAAGATRLEADVKIIDLVGSPALDFRVVLFGGNSQSSRATSTTAISIPADGAWHHLSFDITAAGLTLVLPFDPMANLLANVNRIMIRHQSGSPESGGTPVSARVGFDNIILVPEPVTLWLIAMGAAVAAGRARRVPARCSG